MSAQRDDSKGAVSLRLEQIIQQLQQPNIDARRKSYLMQFYLDDLKVCYDRHYKREFMDYSIAIAGYASKTMDADKATCFYCGAKFGTCSCHKH